MKIYDFVGAPNPKKLRVYLTEKGLRIPFEPVNIVTGDNRKPEFLKKNPMGGLPVLELDDGSCLSESLAIMSTWRSSTRRRPCSARRRASGRACASSSASRRSAS